MKNDKKVSLLFISLLLLLLASLALLFTWGYYKFYYNSKVDKPITQLAAKNQVNSNDDYRDSLQKIYTSTINNISTSQQTTLENTDSVNFDSELNPAGFYKLKNEIEAILKNHPLKADLDIARQKIAELQNKLTELYNKNINAEDENKRLNGKLNQLTNEIKGVEKNIITDRYNKIVSSNTNAASVFTASQLRVTALMVNEGAEQETTQAEKTNKLVGTFTVKSNSTQSNNAEIIVVVLQPDGHVMQGSAWESGSFDTRDGRKIYSSKLNFEYSATESKLLLFSLSTDSYQKGEYTLQIYSNGNIIGNASKTLF
jgi:hypothetical protein